MVEIVGSLLAIGIGGALSMFYFGGLWLTVRRVGDAKHPKALLVGSFVLRTAVVLLGFYLVIQGMGDRWFLLVACLVGFLLGRTVLVRRWRPRVSAST